MIWALTLLILGACRVFPAYGAQQQLFAVVGGNSCASSLCFGPESISEAGSADGLYPYFLSTSTLSKDVPRSQWLQIVTSDGTTELFRIYWTFSVAKTIADRFADAYSTGESVNYRVEVENTGEIFMYTNTTWRYSSASDITAQSFTMNHVNCSFSRQFGAWGAGQGVVDGYGSSILTNKFWGVANFNDIDVNQCYKVYQQGVAYTNYAAAKTYMYYFAPAPPSAAPTVAPSLTPTVFQPTVSNAPSKQPTEIPTKLATTMPTLAPTAPSSAVSMFVTQEVDGVSYSAYLGDQAACNDAFTAAIVNSIPGIGATNLQHLQVVQASRRLLSFNKKLRATERHTLSDTVSLQYTVQVPTSTGLTYDYMSNEITNSVNTNQFTELLQHYASVDNAPELSAASSSSVQTQDTTPSDETSSNDGKTVFTAGVIVGIVIGACAASLVIIYMVRRLYRRPASATEMPLVGSTENSGLSGHRTEHNDQDQQNGTVYQPPGMTYTDPDTSTQRTSNEPTQSNSSASPVPSQRPGSLPVAALAGPEGHSVAFAQVYKEGLEIHEPIV